MFRLIYVTVNIQNVLLWPECTDKTPIDVAIIKKLQVARNG